MSCWNGHRPGMTDEQVHQAMHAYYRAAYQQSWQRAWQSPMNPLGAMAPEPPADKEPQRTTSLPPARPGDKVDAIDVEFVEVTRTHRR